MSDDALSAWWVAHDRVARELIRTHRGREIDKSDGFLVLFERTGDALGFSTAYHAALDRLPNPAQARVGIHAGTVLERTNPAEHVAGGAKAVEIDGRAKPVAARVMAIARGGQTLLTRAAVEAAGGEVAAVSCGFWKLKGIDDPVEICEAAGARHPDGLRADGAAAFRVVRGGDLWIPQAPAPHRLAAERDRFFDRQHLLLELQHRFESGARLVTLMGAGGAGKTRLAQRFGWRSLGDCSGGVWFCDLSQARSAEGVAFAVAQALDVQLTDRDPVAQLGLVIANRGPCLLILDNFEQVVLEAEYTVGRWLGRASEARVVVTSRELLGIPGEFALEVDPLAAADATAMFLERARAAGSTLDPQAAGQVEDVVALLDGLPLAIELAAARSRALPLGDLRQRLHSRLAVLTSQRGRVDRHAALRATIDWSWGLLPDIERAALAQLSVFEGGFNLSAARAVVRVDGAASDMIDLLQSLVDKSLVRKAGEQRFDMLAAIREFSAEQLAASEAVAGRGPDAPASTAARHWHYFASLSERESIAERGVDIDNLVAACNRAVSAGDTRAAARTLVNAWAVIALRGPYRAGVELAEKVLASTALADADRAAGLWVAGSARFSLGETADAQSCFDRGLQLTAGAAAPRIEAGLLAGRGALRTKAGLAQQAEADLQRALVLAEQAGDASLTCNALNALAIAAIEQSRLTDARALCERALAVARAADDIRWQGGLIGNLAQVDYLEGKLQASIDGYRRALDLAVACGDRRWTGNTYCNLGLLLHEAGNSAAGAEHLDAALTIARAIGHRRLECTAECNLGIVNESLGNADLALRYYERAVASAHALTDWRTEVSFRIPLGKLLARAGRVADARANFELAESLLSHKPDPTMRVELLCARAETEWNVGSSASAFMQWLDEARAIVEQDGTEWSAALLSKTRELVAGPVATTVDAQASLRLV